MPLFDYTCNECSHFCELLVSGTDKPVCPACGGTSMAKHLSAPSSLSGPVTPSMPGPGDTACCGSSPGQASGCAGPGSCCGRNG